MHTILINYFSSTNAILQYIDANYEAYLQEEMKIKRSLNTYHDTRVHACLYFIAPTGHSLVNFFFNVFISTNANPI